MIVAATTYGQQKRPEVSLVFGLNQPVVLHGFNFEANVWMKKFVIDYSHGFGLNYDNAFNSAGGKIKTYNTYTLGVGAYYRWLPFKKSDGALRGLTIAPSVRWWPNVGSSLKGNRYEYFNTRTEQNEVHKANNIGLGNTAWFANVSVGWTFMGKNK